MKTYNVTIKAEVYKTITVNAADEDAAYIAAHELFTVAPDFVWPESYNEETINIEQIGDQTDDEDHCRVLHARTIRADIQNR